MIAVEVRGNPKKFNCKKCVNNHHCDDDYLVNGSIGPAGHYIFSIPDIIESKVCLLPMLTDQTYALIRLSRHYKNNMLPVSGGILEQPNYFLQAIDILG